jgi:signal transduction histidine kinase
MLQSLDQWAFQVLFALYGILGIQDIPREPSPDWTVVERWTEQPDKSYRLVLESTTVPEICRRDLSKYVVFPQTYMGQQSIYLDGHLIYTNSLSKKWNLTSVFDRPFISCKILVGSKIVFITDAYIQFFNGISAYPQIGSYYPIANFFYNSIYLVAASICICLGIIGAVIISKIESPERPPIILLRDVVLGLLMISYIPGYFFDADIKYFHYLMGITLSSGFIFLVKPIFSVATKSSSFNILLGINFVVWSLIFSQRNSIQLIAIICCFSFIGILFLANLLILLDREKKHKLSRFEKIIYFSILIMGAQDVYIADISREGFYHLSIVIIIVSVANFLRVLREVQRHDSENATIKEKLKNENIVIAALSSLHELYREVIHDLKSPVTALSFLARRNAVGDPVLSNVALRFNEILSKLERADGHVIAADWYSSCHLMESIKIIIEEKKIHLQNAKFDLTIPDSTFEMFFDPIEFKIIISELIDNSVKHSLGGLVVRLFVALESPESDWVRIVLSDNGPGVDGDALKVLGQKGYSTSGGGLGIFSIIKRVEGVGGVINFQSEEGLVCVIKFKARSI